MVRNAVQRLQVLSVFFAEVREMLPHRTAFLLVIYIALACGRGVAQQVPSAELHPIPEFQMRMDGPVIRQAVRVGEPFTVAGLQGMIAGQQQGPCEIWILPVKLLSHLTIKADVQGYPVPLDLNSMAREIEVRPDRTTITYSHIAVTVRQIMLAPEDSPSGTGAVVLFQVDAVRPVTLTIRFTPEVREMWPKPSNAAPSAEWVARGGGGFYLLHTDFPDLAAAVALPGGVSGIMAPYQERPQFHPLEFILHIDPAKDQKRLFPLLMAVGQDKAAASNSSLEARLLELNGRLPQLYDAHAAYYAQRQRELTSILTPDRDLNADLFWAEISIGQLRARMTPTQEEPTGEVGMVAGYYASGDSARPGFGWYFGRDTLYTVYAMDSYGDFPMARAALEFLLRRQRPDGKVMHEYSQTAAMVDWASLPYEFAAADATPLMLTAMLDYVHTSGDLQFLRDHRESVLKAWRFETTHDSDGDGIYDNAQGTGWVENWSAGMPKQEIYLALLDEQASLAMTQLATLLDDKATASAAEDRAVKLHATIEREYYRRDADGYAFSRNPDGSLDMTSTLFPAIAWWNNGTVLDHAQASLRRWASHDFATDWGVRDVAESAAIYDPISYHQGSVWPLFTGWAALAQYRGGHPLAGYQAVMANADLTQAQDPGAVTELLSGAFFEPFGRSTSHQLWSSAMVATPLLRGLFGIDVDAIRHTIRVTPHLPAAWPSAEVARLRVGDSVVSVRYKREGTAMLLSVDTQSGPAVHLDGGSDSMRIPLPPIEISIAHGLPQRGARTSQTKVIEEIAGTSSLHLTLEGIADSESTLTLVKNDSAVKPRVEGAQIVGNQLQVHFPPGSGYVSQSVTVSW
jgi:glycogen debranching enzyme